MELLTAREFDALKPCIDGLTKLADGDKEPTTDAQRCFVRAVREQARPATTYETAFLKWSALGRPALTRDLVEAPPATPLIQSAAPENPADDAKPKKRKRKRSVKAKTGMSVSAAKAPRKPRWTPEQIEAMNRLSGLSRVRAKIVNGGGVNPR
jgi:hypothetical protein